MVRVGITGIGGYGRVLLDLLLGAQRDGRGSLDAAVVSMVEQDAEHLAHLRALSPTTRIFKTLEEAVDSGIELDVMVLPVGIGAHKDLTLSALDAGWNVLVEKPLAGSVSDAEAMIQAAESSERFVAVGYQDVYDPGVLAVKQALVDGEIGDVKSVRTSGLWGRPVDYYQRNAWAGRIRYKGRSVYDSPFNNGLAHALNMAFFLTGSKLNASAIPVSVSGKMWRAHSIESCDTAYLQWTTERGHELSILFSHTGIEQLGPKLILEGEKGTVYWKFNSHLELCPNDGEPVRYDFPELSDLRRQMVLRVLRRINDPQQAVYTPRQAAAQVLAVELAHRQIEIQDFDPVRVQKISTIGEDGDTHDWLEVAGLQEINDAFFANGHCASVQSSLEDMTK